ncbi:hypothetical protein ACQY0O_002806 [Thecaphora frezii]
MSDTTPRNRIAAGDPRSLPQPPSMHRQSKQPAARRVPLPTPPPPPQAQVQAQVQHPPSTRSAAAAPLSNVPSRIAYSYSAARTDRASTYNVVAPHDASVPGSASPRAYAAAPLPPAAARRPHAAYRASYAPPPSGLHPSSPRIAAAAALATAPPPHRAKLRHTATAPPGPAPGLSAAAAAASNRQPQPCPQCHVHQSKFYCEACLARRIADHHRETQRLSQARDRAKLAVERLLGLREGARCFGGTLTARAGPQPAQGVHQVPAAALPAHLPPNPDQLPDPFGDVADQEAARAIPTAAPAANAPNLDLLVAVQLRAKAAQLEDRLRELRTATEESRSAQQRSQEAVSVMRSRLAKRRDNLRQVWINLGGDELLASRGRGATAGAGAGSGAGAGAGDPPGGPKPRLVDRWRPQRSPGAWPGDDPNFNADAYDGHAWSTDVYQKWDHQDLDSDPDLLPQRGQARPEGGASGADEASAITAIGVGALVEWLRSDIQQLEERRAAAAEELQRTRAILAREAFAIFDIRPPPERDLWQKTGHSGAATSASMGRRGSHAGRTTSLSERYMPGAFAFGRDPDRFASPNPSNPSVFGPSGRRGLLEASGVDASSGRGATSAGGGGVGSDLASASNPNDWTIAGLVLPLPSDIRRFPRDSINGAITHTVHLLQLLTSYLGISLPFAIGVQGGKVSIRPNSMWDGGGGSSKQALHLSSAAYAVLSAPPAGVGGSTASRLGLGESTLNLGASTLSTLESFIQLPPRSHLSWALASTLSGPASKDGKAADKAGGGGGGSGTSSASPEPSSNRSDERSGIDASHRSGGGGRSHRSQRADPGAQAARAFCAALVMLSYDIAYLAATQGVKVDLVSAGGSGLRLLHLTIAHPNLGLRSHANHDRKTEIKDLGFSGLDYDQLVQLLEPMKTGSSKSYAASSSSTPLSAAAPGTSSAKGAPAVAATAASQPSSRKPERKSAKASKPSSFNAVMEQSYIDVGQAAASVLDVGDAAELSTKTSGRCGDRAAAALEIGSDHRRTASAAATRLPLNEGEVRRSRSSGGGGAGRATKAPTTSSPVSLDFLRRRGQDVGHRKPHAATARSSQSKEATTPASEPVPAPASAPAPSSAGAVIFNGIEICAGSGAANGGNVGGGGGGTGTRGSTARTEGRASRSAAPPNHYRRSASSSGAGVGGWGGDDDDDDDEEGWDLI